jgi:hypothetical protein
MNRLNIGDSVTVHKTGVDSGCVGDGATVNVESIQVLDGKILYTGTYKTACGADSIQFAEGEYEIVNHASN